MIMEEVSGWRPKMVRQDRTSSEVSRYRGSPHRRDFLEQTETLLQQDSRLSERAIKGLRFFRRQTSPIDLEGLRSLRVGFHIELDQLLLVHEKDRERLLSERTAEASAAAPRVQATEPEPPATRPILAHSPDFASVNPHGGLELSALQQALVTHLRQQPEQTGDVEEMYDRFYPDKLNPANAMKMLIHRTNEKLKGRQIIWQEAGKVMLK